MKDHTPHDPINIVGEAYELLLEKTLHDLHVQDGKSASKPLPLIHRLHKRDGDQNNLPESEISQWLEAEKDLIKTSIIELLQHAADRTTLELRRLNSLNQLPDELFSDKHSNMKKLHGDRSSPPVESARKIRTPQYKNCDNKSFRRQQ